MNNNGLSNKLNQNKELERAKVVPPILSLSDEIKKLKED